MPDLKDASNSSLLPGLAFVCVNHSVGIRFTPSALSSRRVVVVVAAVVVVVVSAAAVVVLVVVVVGIIVLVAPGAG